MKNIISCFCLLLSLNSLAQSLPMTVTQTEFNNGNIFYSKPSASWDGGNGIMSSSAGGECSFKFADAPQRISLEHSRSGGAWFPDIQVYESSNGSNWSKLLSTGSSSSWQNWNSNLNRETRYIKLKYSGTLSGWWRSISIAKSLNVSTATLSDFQTPIGESESRTFTLNASNLAGNLTIESNNPNFSVSPTSITPQEAANGATVNVVFTAPNTGSRIENCEVSVYDAGYPTNVEKVSVVGNIIAAQLQTPTINPFTTVQGLVVSEDIDVTGTDLKGAINLIVSGTDGAFFSLDKSSLPTSGKVRVSYLPLTAGNHSATLTLSSEYAVDVAVPLSGTASESPTNGLFAPLVVTESVFNNPDIVSRSGIKWNGGKMNSGGGTMTIKLDGTPARITLDYSCQPASINPYINVEESNNGVDWKRIASPGVSSSWQSINQVLNPRSRWVRIAYGVGSLQMWIRNVVIHKNEIQSTRTEAETFRKPIGEKESVSFWIQSTLLSGDLLLSSDNPNFLVAPTSLTKADAERLCGSEVTITYQPTVTGTNIGTIRLSDAGNANRNLEIPVKGITTPSAPFRFTHSAMSPIGFTIAWEAIEGVSEYLFSMYKVVETDTTLVEGYDQKPINATTVSISELEKGTQYIYRVWSKQGEAVSDEPSPVQSIQTLIAPEIIHSFISEFATIEQQSVAQSVTIDGNHLQGAIALTLSGTNKSLFSISETSVTDSATVVVTFHAPAEKGIYNATLTLSSPYANDVIINLTGRYATFAGAFDETTINETAFNSPTIVSNKSMVSWGSGAIDSGDGEGSFVVNLSSAPHTLFFECSRNKWGQNNKMTVEQSDDNNKWEAVVAFNPSTSWQSCNYLLKTTTRYLRFSYYAKYVAPDMWAKHCYWRNMRITKRNVQTTVRSLPQFNTTTGSAAQQSFKVKGLNLTGDLSLSSSNPSFTVTPNTVSAVEAGTTDGVDITIQYSPTAPSTEESGTIFLADSGNHEHSVVVEVSGKSQLQRVMALPADKLILGGFTANWEATSGAGGYYLTVHKASAPAPGFNNKWVGKVTSFEVTGLDDASTYSYEVRAALEEGSSVVSEWSAPMEATTLPYTELLTPTNLKIENVTTYTFSLSWAPVYRAEGYTVEFFKHGSTTLLKSFYTTSTNYQFKLATPETAYDYTIAAKSRLIPTGDTTRTPTPVTTLPAAETVLVTENTGTTLTIWSQAFSGNKPTEGSEVSIPSNQRVIMDDKDATVGSLRITASGKEVAEVIVTQPMEVKETLCIELTITEAEKGKWLFRSFPFDVHLKTGVRLVNGKNEEYCTYWKEFRASYYDGERRAREGFTADNNRVWIDVKAEDNYLNRGQGYIFAIPQVGTYRIYAADDTLKNVLSPGAKSVKLKEIPTERSQMDGGWNMIGSPILSRYNYSADVTDSRLPKFIYHYNNGRYEIINALDSTFVMSPYVSYLVQSAKDTEWSISPTLQQQQFKARSAVVRENISKYCFELSKNHVSIDKTQVVFNPMSESRYVINEDATKMAYNNETLLWTEINGELFGVNQLPPLAHGEKMMMKAYISEKGLYKINRLTDRGDYSQILIKKRGSSEQPIDLLTSDYTLPAEITGTQTFELTFLKTPTSIVEEPTNGLTIFSEGDNIVIRGSFEKAEFYDMNGLLEATALSQDDRMAMPKGVYFVRIANGEEQQIIKYKH